MKDTKPLQPGQPLPDAIARLLRRFIRRARLVLLLRGLGATVSVALAALLTVMACDAVFTLFAAWLRWTCTLTGLAAVVVAAGLALRPLARSFTLAGAARLIETRHPELHERLSSVVELLTSRDLPEVRGSAALIAALTDEAVQDAAGVRTGREMPWRRALPFLAPALMLSAVLLALLFTRPTATTYYLARAVAPFLNLSNPHAAALTVDPGDIWIPAGTDVRVTVTADRTVETAVLWIRGADGRERPSTLTAVTNANPALRRFVAVLPDVRQAVRYRIRAGKAVTRTYTIDVGQPPAVEQVEVSYTYPDYSRRPPLVETNAGGPIAALAGTDIAIAARISRPVTSATLRIAAATFTNALTGTIVANGTGAVCRFQFSLPRDLAGLWSLHVADAHGLTNRPAAHPILALPDRPPRVRIVNLPRSDIPVNRDDRVPIAYAAEDDLGLQTVALRLQIEGTSNQVMRPLPLPAGSNGPARAAEGIVTLDLAEPALADARRIAVQVRATDTLPPVLQGAQTGWSHTVTLVINEKGLAWNLQMLATGERETRQELQALQQALSNALAQTRALQPALTNTAAVKPQTQQEMAKREQELAAANRKLDDLIKALTNGFFTGLASNLAQRAQEPLRQAETRAGQTRVAEQPAERARLNQETGAAIAQALPAVNDARTALDAMAEATRRALELDKLADRQAALARERAEAEARAQAQAQAKAQAAASAGTSNSAPSAAEMAAERAAEEDWRRAQERLAEQLAAEVRRSTGSTQSAATALERAAGQTAQEAAQLAKQQADAARASREQSEAQRQRAQALRDLAVRQAQLANETRAESTAANAVQPMTEAARTLKEEALDQALRYQTAAERALTARAQTLTQPPPASKKKKSSLPGPQPGTPAARQAAQKLNALAERQREVNRATADLLGREAAQEDQRQRGELDRLQSEQQAVAEAATQLARETAATVPANEPGAAQAAKEAAEQAAAANQSLKQQQTRPAAEAARQAGAALQAAAQRLTKAAEQGLGEKDRSKSSAPPPPTPEGHNSEASPSAVSSPATAPGSPRLSENVPAPSADTTAKAPSRSDTPAAKTPAQLAGQAQDLARREETVARELAALERRQPAEQMAARQQDLARQAQDLARQGEQLRDTARDFGLKTPANQQSQQAAQQLQNAGRQADEAANRLQQAAEKPQAPSAPDTTAQAGNAQQQAAQSLQQAAQSLNQMQASARSQSTPAPADTPGAPSEPNLGEAYAAAREAAASAQASAALEAAAQLSRQADQADREARAHGANPTPAPSVRPPEPGADGTGSEGTKTAAGDAFLRRLGGRLADWLRLRGELQSDVLQAAPEQAPAEYRPLIGRYFEALAEEGGDAE